MKENGAIRMHKILEAWDVTGNGDFILTLNERIPFGHFKKCFVEGVEYVLVPVHIFGASLGTMLKNIGIKASAQTVFIGKEVEFV